MFLSIIVPAYNAEKYIIRNLESLFRQDFKDMEVIVVNDGSSDRTKIKVEEFCASHPQLNIKLINIENGGLANARNVGIKNARGKFFINLDADDFLCDKIVNKLFEKYNETDFDICMYGYQDYNEKNRKFEHPYEETMQYITSVENGEIMALNKVKRNIWICQGSACYRKSIVEKYNIYNIPKLNQGEDFYFITKMLLFSKKVATIPEVGVNISYRDDSMMHSSYNESYLEVFELLDILLKDIQSYDFLKLRSKMIKYLLIEYEIHRLAIAKKIILKFPISKIKTIIENIKSDIPKRKEFYFSLMSFTKRTESFLFNYAIYVYIIFVKLYRRML